MLRRNFISVTVNKHTISFFNPVPVFLAVHGPVAADDGNNLPQPDVPAFFLDLAGVIYAALRLFAAPSQHGVDKEAFDALTVGHFH